MVQSVAEMPKPQEGDFVVRGDGARLFMWLHGVEKMPTREVVYAGPAGTGKTRVGLEFLVECCNKFPKTKLLLFRKTRVSMNESVLDCLENQVLGPTHPAVLGGPTRAHRDKYTFPNGSELVPVGMDAPFKLFSTEYNGGWGNEINELEEDEWEMLHRAFRREGGPPFHFLGGDMNPTYEQHWPYQRCKPDEFGNVRATMLVGRFADNPTLYDLEAKEWTKRGVEYLTALSEGLSGVRRARLLKGLWVGAEGMVWDTYAPERHLITARLEGNAKDGYTLFKKIGFKADGSHAEQEIPLKWFLASHDFGTTAPGSLLIIGIDSEGHMYVVAEHYHTGWDFEDWSERAAELYEEFRYTVGVCDHVPAAISVFNKRCSRGGDMPGLWREWSKKRGSDAEKTGINQTRVRFRLNQLFIVKGALRKVDPALRQKRKPLCLEDEIPAYVYPVTKDGKRNREIPDEGCEDHACDSLRAAVDYAFLKDLSPAPKPQGIIAPPGTIEHSFERQFRERFRPKRRKDNQW